MRKRASIVSSAFSAGERGIFLLICAGIPGIRLRLSHWEPFKLHPHYFLFAWQRIENIEENLNIA